MRPAVVLRPLSLAVLAGWLLRTELASADCVEGDSTCCGRGPVVTGTVVDAGGDAVALAIDWAADGAVGRPGDIGRMSGPWRPPGTRLLAFENPPPPSCPAPDCPSYSKTVDIDGGRAECSLIVAGAPATTLTEQELRSVAARSDCYDALKVRLGLAGEDLCDGANDHNQSCLCASTLTEDPARRAIATPLALGLGLAVVAVLRARSRRSRATRP